jgi:hypothetical protein
MPDADANKAAAEAAAKLKSLGNTPVIPIKPLWMWIAMVAFMIAGLAGGIIASSITQAYGQSGNESAASFLDKPTGPSNFEWFYFSGRTWTQVEHIAFWLGLISAVLSVLRGTNTTSFW